MMFRHFLKFLFHFVFGPWLGSSLTGLGANSWLMDHSLVNWGWGSDLCLQGPRPLYYLDHVLVIPVVYFVFVIFHPFVDDDVVTSTCAVCPKVIFAQILAVILNSSLHLRLWCLCGLYFLVGFELLIETFRLRWF